MMVLRTCRHYHLIDNLRYFTLNNLSYVGPNHVVAGSMSVTDTSNPYYHYNYMHLFAFDDYVASSPGWASQGSP